MNRHQESLLLERAVEGFTASTETSEAMLILAPNAGSKDDIIIELRHTGGATRYCAAVKLKVDRDATLQALKSGGSRDVHTLLVTSQLSEKMARRCRELDLQYIDTAGNAYLNNRKGIYIFVSGRRETSPVFPKDHRTATPASLKVTFALLTRPQLLNAPFREISYSARVSLGAVGQVFVGLQSRGFIGVDGSGKRAFLNREHLIVDWTAGYLNRLRPKLQSRRFIVSNPDDLMLYAPKPGIATWGGEVAAARLTRHLKPSAFILYQDPDESVLASLVSRYRLKADPNGPLEIVDAFWNGEALGIGQTAPAELVYADLIATQDPRNLETAKILLSKVIINA